MDFERFEFRLGYVGSAFGKICFAFDFIIHTAYTHISMRTYQHSAYTVLDRYILKCGHKSDAGVGSGRRNGFLDCHGFRFLSTF